jgi:hypothetical protein
MSSHHPALKGKIVRALPGLLDTDNSVPDYPPETWAVAAPKRTFAAPMAVGTIDQALLSIIRARHAWMRAAFLSRHLLVVDDVHASDPYMASLTRSLIERHLSLGGRALAMSATLGETALAILMDANDDHLMRLWLRRTRPSDVVLVIRHCPKSPAAASRWLLSHTSKRFRALAQQHLMNKACCGSGARLLTQLQIFGPLTGLD